MTWQRCSPASSAAGKRLEYLDLARENLRQGQQVINDLLAYASIGKEKLQKEWIDVHAFCAQVVQDQLAHLGSAGIDFECDFSADIYADPNLLRHLLNNLVNNAIKFSREEDAPVLRMGSYQEADQTVLFVTDNGVGFDARFSSLLGQPFKRLHGSEFAGSGIGLSAVRLIMDLHEGKLWAEAEVGKGATFFCSFPGRAPAEASPLSILSAQPS
ncbi:MAG: sensor histidine kinase [Lewinella sp.]|nr:sensor histidine kinase [Lewinella sp.]